MNEYVKFYIENLTRYVELPEGRIVLNDIARIDLGDAVSCIQNIEIGKGKERLSESVFVKDITLQIYLGSLDAENLWELSVLLYVIVARQAVATVSLTIADEYMRLFNALANGMDVSSIELRGKVKVEVKEKDKDTGKDKVKVKDKTKIVVINNDELLTKMLDSFVWLYDEIITEDNLKHYTLSNLTTIGELADKRTLDYYFAKELEDFMRCYLGSITDKEKRLILQILYLFGRYKDDPTITTDNYRRLMSDGKKLTVDTSVLMLEGEPLPFTIIANPEIEKIRQEYAKLTTRCEK